MKSNNHDLLDRLPTPMPGLPFALQKIEDVILPHPYCITPKHLAYADSMYLDAAAIKRAETRGAQCDICRQLVKRRQQSAVLAYSEHESQKTLFIAVNDNRDLNAIDGLHDYLLQIKPVAESLGIQGFAFPMSKVDNSDV